MVQKLFDFVSTQVYRIYLKLEIFFHFQVFCCNSTRVIAQEQSNEDTFDSKKQEEEKDFSEKNTVIEYRLRQYKQSGRVRRQQQAEGRLVPIDRHSSN